jgi:hypothetical protein
METIMKIEINTTWAPVTVVQEIETRQQMYDLCMSLRDVDHSHEFGDFLDVLCYGASLHGSFPGELRITLESFEELYELERFMGNGHGSAVGFSLYSKLANLKKEFVMMED